MGLEWRALGAEDSRRGRPQRHRSSDCIRPRPPGAPEPLPGSALALNPSTGRLTLCNCGPMLTLPALLSWTGRTWVLLDVARLPVEPVAEISDATSGRLLIFGSATRSTQFVAQ